MKFNFKFSNLCGTVYRAGNLIFTPDGNSVLSPVGNRITIFDLVNHKSRTMPFENKRNIVRIALSPDGSRLITVDERGHALLVNFFKMVVLCQFQFKSEVEDLQFSPNGKYIAVTKAMHLQVWRAPEAVTQFNPFHLLRTYTGHYDDITCISWTPDSEFIVTGSKDMTCRLYSANPIKGYVPVTITGHRHHVCGVFFRHGLKAGLEESMYSVGKDGALFVWKFSSIDGEEGEDDAEKKGHKGRRYGVDRSFKKRNNLEEVPKDAHWMARININVVRKHYFEQNHAKVTCCKMHIAKEAELLVVGFDSGVFGLYELPYFNMVHTLSISQKRITSVAINPSGEWLAFGASKLGQLLVWEWQSETYILKQQGHFFDMNWLSYSPDGQLIATGGDDGKVKIWNASTGFCFVTFKDHAGPVNQVVFSPKGNVVLSSSLDGTVRAFDLVRYRNFRTFTSPEPTQFTCLAIDNSGEMVVAGSLDPYEIYVWSLRTARLLDILSGHTGPISGVVFNPAHPYLVSSSWDRTVKIWDLYNRKVAVETLTHSSDVLAVAVRPDGDEVCASDLTGQLYFWDPQDGTCKGTIEGHKDIMGGRRRDDPREAKNQTHSVAFTSMCYSSDGKCLLAGGNCKFVCIYHVKQRVLLKRFEITNNLSLDGIQAFLNSRDMTEAGPMSLIDDPDSGSDPEDHKDKSLPGAKRSDFSKRNTPLVARTKCVMFSPDGRQWAAASTEGLLIYSVDQALFFDPQDLDMDVTPENTKMLLSDKKFAKSLVMALRLNEDDLMKEVIEEVPYEEIYLVAGNVPSVYVERLLKIISDKIQESPHIQYYLMWIQAIFTAHAVTLQKNSMRILSTMRSLHRNVGSKYNLLAPICQENQHMLGYLVKKKPTNPLEAGGAGGEREDLFSVIAREKLNEKISGSARDEAKKGVVEEKGAKDMDKKKKKKKSRKRNVSS